MSVDLKKCARCGLPTTFETLELGDDGVCNLCKASDVLRADDWPAREKEFNAIVEQHRGRYAYDCIIPSSGGKDSTHVLYQMVTKHKVKPLVVTFDHGFFRNGLLENNRRVLKQLGVDCQVFTPNWKLVKRIMREALIRRGDHCLHCHLGTFAYPMRAAIKERVPLIIWGEPSSQYTAYYKPGEVEEVDETRFDKFVNMGLAAEDIGEIIKSDFDFDFRDLNPFIYPKRAELAALGVRSICYGSYFPWNAEAQTAVIERELGWKRDEVEGVPHRYSYTKLECWTQGVRDYLKELKRGYGRTTQMVATDRRYGRMTKEEGDALIKEHEGKRPASLDLFLEYVEMTEEEFNQAVLATVVPPHVPDFNRPRGKEPHDFNKWYREPKA